jgi:hypothetical protein
MEEMRLLNAWNAVCSVQHAHAAVSPALTASTPNSIKVHEAHACEPLVISTCCSCAACPHLDPTRVFSFTTMSLASSDQPGIAGSFRDTVVFSTSVPVGRVSAKAVRMLLAEPAAAAILYSIFRVCVL